MHESEVVIVGIGIHPFGRHEGVSGLEQGAIAARAALADAGCAWSDIDVAYGGSVASGAADSLVSILGLTGVPFVNVANGCATGGSSLMAAFDALRSRQCDLGLVVGFDKHPRGAFNADPALLGLPDWYAQAGMMLTTQFFGMKLRRYMHDFGITEDALARVAAKAFRNGERNPNAWRRKPISEEEIRNSFVIADPLTQYMFCAPAEGAVALVVARAESAPAGSRPVTLRSAVLASRRHGTFEVFSPSLSSTRAPSPSVFAAQGALEMAGVSVSEIDVAQIQDTESGAEIMHMAETGLCADGDQEALVMSGATEVDGSLPVNTDGGCLANGEPIGASGLRQIHENVVQLRGDAGERQVPGEPKVALSHVYGAPGISACTVITA
jgi:acetyl-CoA C-acetyltransferase